MIPARWGVAWMFPMRAALLRLSPAIPMTARAGVQR